MGYAGTGKSRLLGAAREAWESSGYRVMGATLSGIAAENLESSSGVTSQTLASRLIAWEKGNDLLTSHDILVIDEAGMLGTRQLAEVVDEANKRGTKLVLVGDTEQLQAIEAGAAFRGILHHTASKIELTEIWRQQEDWQKEATVLFSTRQTNDAIAKYAEHHCVHQYMTQAQARQALIEAWNDVRISQPDKTQIMLAFTRDDVQGLNEGARSLRQSLGELGSDHLIPTERGDKLFATGDKVYFLKNDKELGVKNGTLGTILDINEDTLIVKLNKEDKNQDKVIKFSTHQYHYLDHGYASTIHKGQGGTFDRTFVLASQYLDRQATNVAMTRHRESTELFWSKEAFPSYDDMVKSLSRNSSKDLAHDYVDLEFAKASFAGYRGLDTLWDKFWEQHGKEWLEKIQQTLSAWGDSIKEYVQTIQEKMVNALNPKDDKISSESLSKEEIWLKEMRAWLGDHHDTQSDREIKKDTYFQIEKTEGIPHDRDAHYAALYQQLMQDAKMHENQKIIDEMMKKHEALSEPSKTIAKELDKEMEF